MKSTYRASSVRHLPAVLVGLMPLLLSATFLGRHEIAVFLGDWHSRNDARFMTQVLSQPTESEPTPWVAFEFPHYTRIRPASFAHTVNPLDRFNLPADKLFNDYRFAPGTTLDNPKAGGAPGLQLALLSRTAPMALARPDSVANQYHTVVLDPGHGGTDPGTIGVDGLLEKELTLEIANRVRDLLRTHPHIKVRLTRETDRGFSRDNRVNHIRAARADLLVSLHLNNLPQRNLTVVETFYADKENIIESELEREAARTAAAGASTKLHRIAGNTLPDYSFTKKSATIAHLLQRYIYREVSRSNPAAVDNGVKTDTLYTLTRSHMPAALIELTCLSNNSEEQRLKSADYRQKISVSIAEALIEYFATLDAPQSI